MHFIVYLTTGDERLPVWGNIAGERFDAVSDGISDCFRRDADDGLISGLHLDGILRHLLDDGLSLCREIGHILQILDIHTIRLDLFIEREEIRRDALGRADFFPVRPAPELRIRLAAGHKTRIASRNGRCLGRDAVREIASSILFSRYDADTVAPRLRLQLDGLLCIGLEIFDARSRQIGHILEVGDILRIRRGLVIERFEIRRRRIRLLDVFAIGIQMHFAIDRAARDKRFRICPDGSRLRLDRIRFDILFDAINRLCRFRARDFDGRLIGRDDIDDTQLRKIVVQTL